MQPGRGGTLRSTVQDRNEEGRGPPLTERMEPEAVGKIMDHLFPQLPALFYHLNAIIMFTFLLQQRWRTSLPIISSCRIRSVHLSESVTTAAFQGEKGKSQLDEKRNVFNTFNMQDNIYSPFPPLSLSWIPIRSATLAAIQARCALNCHARASIQFFSAFFFYFGDLL